MTRANLVPFLGGDLTTLLAVEDSKTMRKVLEITFAGESFETRIAANTNEAFGLLAERPISIALVDVTLGEQSGYDVCKRIKSDYPAVKVLLLSSKQSPYDAARGVSSGADDHLDKPFDTQVLIDKVRALFTRIAAQPALPQVTLAPAPDKPTAAAAFPVHTSDSKIPTAMPEAPTDELLDDEGPLLIPIEDELESGPSPITVAPVAAPVAAAPIATPVAAAPIAIPAAAIPAAAIPVAAAPVAPAPVAIPITAVEEAAELAPVARTVIMHKGADHTLPVKSAANGVAAFAPLETKLSALGLTEEQVSAVLALSREVVEAAVWEVVPTLAETLIKEEIRRLTQ